MPFIYTLGVLTVAVLSNQYGWWLLHSRAEDKRRGEPPFSIDDILSRWIPTVALTAFGIAMFVLGVGEVTR